MIYMVKPMESKLTVPCSFVHVRRANFVLHGSQARTYFPISDYVNLLPSRTDTVLLLTDDANAIAEALEFHPDISCVYFDSKHGTYIGFGRTRPQTGGRYNPISSQTGTTMLHLDSFSIHRCP
jgi:hypothetical protein